MLKRLLTGLMLLAVATTAAAQDVPTPFPSLNLETAVIVTASAADILTTDWPRPQPLHEMNPLLPDHRGANAALQAATTAAIVLLVRHYGPSHPKLARGLTVALGALGTIDTAHNLYVHRRR